MDCDQKMRVFIVRMDLIDRIERLVEELVRWYVKNMSKLLPPVLAKDDTCRKLRQRAFAPQRPPTGFWIGKRTLPRARANLPAGMRKRFIEEEQ